MCPYPYQSWWSASNLRMTHLDPIIIVMCLVLVIFLSLFCLACCSVIFITASLPGETSGASWSVNRLLPTRGLTANHCTWKGTHYACKWSGCRTSCKSQPKVVFSTQCHACWYTTSIVLLPGPCVLPMKDTLLVGRISCSMASLGTSSSLFLATV